MELCYVACKRQAFMKLSKFKSSPEIFFSIQGEGKNVGCPRVFVRLSGCNLRCGWCDTPYTWDWKRFDKQKEIILLPIEEVVAEIQKFPCKEVVFTGGEPLLQQRELVQVMEKLKPLGYFFEVETNATIQPLFSFDALMDQYNCSPKLENSGNSILSREISKALHFFAKNPKVFFKFVVSEEKDFTEINTLILKYQIPKEKIYLMPEGKTKKALKRKEPWLLPLCETHGFSFSRRLHIEQFGNRRAV